MLIGAGGFGVDIDNNMEVAMKELIYRATELLLFLVVSPFALFLLTKFKCFYYLSSIFLMLYCMAQLILYIFYKEIFIKGVHYANKSAQWLCAVMIGFIMIAVLMLFVPLHYFD